MILWKSFEESVKGEEKVYKNKEGYPDPTAGDGMRAAARMPAHVYNVYSVLNQVAGLHGFELIGLRDRKTGKEYRKR